MAEKVVSKLTRSQKRIIHRKKTMKPRKQKVFERSKGFYGRGKNCYSIAKRKTDKAMQYMFVSRKLRKRENRKTWMIRINAATKQYTETNNIPVFEGDVNSPISVEGLKKTPESKRLNYSTFVNGLIQCNIELNRKMLAELAVSEPFSFTCLMKEVQREVSPIRRTILDNFDEDDQDEDSEVLPDSYYWAFKKLSPEKQEDAIEYLNLLNRISDLNLKHDLIPFEESVVPGPATQEWLKKNQTKTFKDDVHAKLSTILDIPHQKTDTDENTIDRQVPEEVYQEMINTHKGKNVSTVSTYSDRLKKFHEETEKRRKYKEDKINKLKELKKE